jgi:hypothetical protein
MRIGFVYVMINPALRGLVKIGLSERTPEQRAKELRGTGVPDDFIVIYYELVTDCNFVEKRLHARFDEYRHQPNREFFRIPIRQAIIGLMEESNGFLISRFGVNGGVEMLPDLKRKYSNYIRPEFHSIKIVHCDEIVYLESVRYRHSGLRDEIIERVDLGFIVIGVDKMFLVSRSPEDNARIFISQLDKYAMIQCTDLFTDEAYLEINQKRKFNKL